jgi:hypothetical protein
MAAADYKLSLKRYPPVEQNDYEESWGVDAWYAAGGFATKQEALAHAQPFEDAAAEAGAALHPAAAPRKTSARAGVNS